MNAVSVAVEERLLSALPGCDFADAYRAGFAAPAPNARGAATAIFNATPHWVDALMGLRNHLVRPFGLKAGDRTGAAQAQSKIGIFPVLRESPREMLLGLDDQHLDFRVAVTVDTAVDGTPWVTVTTLVRRHNRLGRIYLALIMPFHRLIARSMLAGAAKRWNQANP